MDLAALADCDLVAAHGGFGPAARASGRSKATLSRRVADLEARLGVRLLERGERRVRLTEAGAELHARAAGPLGDLAEAVDLVGRPDGRLRGTLRISAAVVFAHAHLARLAARFSVDHPEVRLEVVADDRVVDLVEERVDLVIRANPPADERLVGRCFVRTDRVAVAAPTLARPGDGEAAPLVYRLGETIPAGWTLRDGGGHRACPLRPALGLSTLLMVREAAIQGAGVALAPRTLVADDLARGRLVSWGVLDGAVTELWALHTSRRLASPKVRAFMACLEAAFPAEAAAPAAASRASPGAAR